MKLVLDAYPLIGFLLDEPVAGEIDGLLRRESARISAVNLGEALDAVERCGRVPRLDVELAITPLLGTSLRVEPATELACLAGRGASRTP